MTHEFDEFSKWIGGRSMPRRESLKKLGFAVTATILAPLGAPYAQAGKQPRAPKPQACKAFCKCANKRQLDQCLIACKACGNSPVRLAGRCGTYFCCGAGLLACGNYCADLANDPSNCGACGYECDEPGLYEIGACIDGHCEYACFEGAAECAGICTFLDSDPKHCGACGNSCPGTAPICDQGTCRRCASGQTLCGETCIDLDSDSTNCGACGNVCDAETPYCHDGACTYCGGYGAAMCDGVCINILSDNGNCGGCGVQCAADEICTFGACSGTCSGC